MATANDSFQKLADGSGTLIATHLISGKEYPVGMMANSDGTLVGTNDAYRLWVPPAAVGASKVYFDLFNATGTGKTLRLVRAAIIVDGTVAVVGVVAVALFLTRTTAIGTGGTASTTEGTSLTAATISKLDPGAATLPAGVTARLGPTAGATAGALIGATQVFPEETNAGAYTPKFLHEPVGYDCVFPENSGLRVVQGAVASVGSIGYVFDFVLV